MLKVQVFNKKIIILGHTDYAEYGKDIVCSSASSIVITSVNAALRIDNNSITMLEEANKVTININTDDKIILLIMENMLNMLEELANTYKKNIKILKEERL